MHSYFKDDGYMQYVGHSTENKRDWILQRKWVRLRELNFKNYDTTEALVKGVEGVFDGHLADFAFQCTGSPVGHSNVYKFIRNGGGLCELGFFINGGDATINPHFDICSKELTIVGSWVYTLRDYATTFDFLKSANR
jgi:threonine dehydrogenase-like Zn-dependent dehydrogenase